MADRIADNADLAVDEVKRRARRRLVGAVVLALAAAIILPMLLENEPRPLGDDVSVQIPPVDEGKFINRLTGKSGDTRPLPKADGKVDPKAGSPKPDAKAESAAQEKTEPNADVTTAVPAARGSPSEPGATPPPGKSLAEAEQRVLAPAPKAPAKADAKAEAKTATAKPAPKAAPAEAKAAATEPPPASLASASPAAVAASTPAPSPSATKAAAPAPAKAEGFVVQLAAFADDKGANALVNKLVKGGYSAYVEPVQTSRGTLWRVRVGGYASRPDADAARAKLKGEGYSGIVAPAK